MGEIMKKYILTLATGEVFNIEVTSIWHAINTGNRYNVNFSLEKVWTPEEAYRVWKEEKDLS